MIKGLLFKYIPARIIYLLKRVNRMDIIFTYYCLRIFPINNKKIVITNFYGKGYGDNCKYIAEEVLRRKLGCDIVWIVKSDNKMDLPKQIRTVRYD